jgi:hypothetical protein
MAQSGGQWKPNSLFYMALDCCEYDVVVDCWQFFTYNSVSQHEPINAFKKAAINCIIRK